VTSTRRPAHCDGRQGDTVHAVGERVGNQLSAAERQPRLASAAGPGERQQTHVLTHEQCGDRGKLVLSADE
jgi:hypothetical protein